MLTVSIRTLNLLAAFVWYAGGIILLLKGCSLLLEAKSLEPEQDWPLLAAIAGLLIGGLKARFIFNKSCRKNLARIAALNRPKIWQFYRPWFFVFLIAMSVTGATLSKLAHNNYSFLLFVAVFDISIAVALLGSSHVFWRQKAFVG